MLATLKRLHIVFKDPYTHTTIIHRYIYLYLYLYLCIHMHIVNVGRYILIYTLPARVYSRLFVKVTVKFVVL